MYIQGTCACALYTNEYACLIIAKLATHLMLLYTWSKKRLILIYSVRFDTWTCTRSTTYMSIMMSFAVLLESVRVF